MSTLKANPCKLCSSTYHTAFQCPTKPRTALKQATKPMRKEAVKTRSKRLTTSKEWFKANPPNANGNWFCYISKHPDCPKVLNRHTIVLEHNLSKARRPDLINDIKNIFPSCAVDNKYKGSLSAKQYLDNGNLSE